MKVGVRNALIALLTVFAAFSMLTPLAHAQFNWASLGSIGAPATAISSVDYNSDGIPDTAVITTSVTIKSYGIGVYQTSINDASDIAAVDINSDGKLEGIIVAGGDIVALSPSGEIWRLENTRGYSAVTVDINNDGKLNEVIIGGSGKVFAVNAADGEILWNYTQEGTNFKHLAAGDDYVFAGSVPDKILFTITYSGNLQATQIIPDAIGALAAIDLEGAGVLNGVVSVSLDGYIQGFDSGLNEKWFIDRSHDGSVTIHMYTVDKNSNGKLDHVVFNLGGHKVYWVNANGLTVGQANPASASSIAPIDYDGDGILDDLIVGKESETAGKVHALNANGQELAVFNQTGANMITAIDYDSDGLVNDAIIVDKTFNVYWLGPLFTDTTTSAPPQTTPPPTTAPPTTAPPTTAPPTTAPPTTAPPVQELTIDLGKDITVSEGTEVVIEASISPSPTEDATYLWTEGDQILGRERTLKRVLPVGTHEIQIEVHDRGLRSTASIRVTVNPAKPQVLTVDAGPDITTVEGAIITLTANATPSKPGGSIISYQWTEDSKILGNTPSIAINLPTGDYQITVTVIDDTGATASDSVTVTVLPTTEGLIPSLGMENLGQYSDILKLIVAAGVGIFLLIYIREKILDFLWERRRDYME